MSCTEKYLLRMGAFNVFEKKASLAWHGLWFVQIMFVLHNHGMYWRFSALQKIQPLEYKEQGSYNATLLKHFSCVF